MMMINIFLHTGYLFTYIDIGFSPAQKNKKGQKNSKDASCTHKIRGKANRLNTEPRLSA